MTAAQEELHRLWRATTLLLRFLLFQPCFLFAHAEELESYLEGLRRYPGVDVDNALSSGLLVIGEAPGSTVDEALDYWERALWQAMDNKAAIVRAVGEMASERNGFIS